MENVTLNKLVYDLKNLASGGIQSDDSKISDRQIAYWIAQGRALLIRQEFSNRKKLHDAWVQHWIMEFEKVNASIDAGCYPACCKEVYRSKCKFPTTIQRGHANGVIAVTSIDGSTSYGETSFHRAKFHTSGKYTKEDPRWYIKGEYLYIIGNPKQLQISALLEDPANITECAKCEDDECWTWDSPYPITLEMAGRLTEMLLKKINVMLVAPQDDHNNANNGQQIDAK